MYFARANVDSQLALHLRTAFLKKSSETTRAVSSAQFLNCVRLWTRVICALPDPEVGGDHCPFSLSLLLLWKPYPVYSMFRPTKSQKGLGKLAFPLSQIAFGVIAILPSVYYTPLKFHLVGCLHQLAAVVAVDLFR